MLSISAIAKREKNKLYTDSVFIIILDIDLGYDTVRICLNTDDIVWNGNIYQAFPFDFGDVKESTDNSDPNVELRVDNTSRALQSIVEQANGGNGFPVILRIVNTEALDNFIPEVEESYVVNKTSVTEQYITFTIGAEYSARTRRPLNRYMKNNCPFKYKGLRCGYNGNLPECDHSLVGCREHNNSVRFGGFVGIDQKGVYVK